MEPKKIRAKPEATLADKVDDFLRGRGWYVKVIVGNAYQSGLPDRLITHRNHGLRLVEYKYAERYHFTPAQLEVFPLLLVNGTGVWILTDATEAEYKKLFEPPNFHHYIGRSKKWI